MFRLQIETGNAAFHEDGAGEISRILENVAERVKNGDHTGIVRDVNGNTVGSFELEIDSSEE